MMATTYHRSPRNSPSRASETLAFLERKKLQVEFELEDTPYTPVLNIGTGAYGVVCSAIDDSKNGKKVAIKKIPKAFGALTLIKRTLREVRILSHFRHENIVAVLDMFHSAGDTGKDVYMVMDLMETDLHQIIHSKQPLSEQHLQYFLYQILRGLKYIHSAGVAHRDLKPSNLLVNGDCLLKIGDFGMARSLGQSPENQSTLTQYVATRWYRAPEILFSMVDYDCSVDIWSVGCIFAEMVMRRQLFPGKDGMSQLKLIVYYLGTPPAEVMDRIDSEIITRIIHSQGYCEPLPWQAILPKATEDGIDLAERMMRIAPWNRTTAAEALEHPYLASFHDPHSEPVCSRQVMLETDSLEQLNPDDLKRALENEVVHFRGRSPKSSIQTSTATQNHNFNHSNSDQHEQISDGNGTHHSDDDDVIMLSARLEDKVCLAQTEENSLNNSNSSIRKTARSQVLHPVQTSEEKPLEGVALLKDAKARLRDALHARQKAAQKLQESKLKDRLPQSQINSETTNGYHPHENGSSTTNGHVTAQSRHLERQEKRKKRQAKQRLTQQDMLGVSQSEDPTSSEEGLSEQDQSLLERWKQMQERSEQNKLEGQIGDIISRTLPSPLASGVSVMSVQEGSSDWTNGNHQRSATPKQTMDSAQLMDTWLEATNMNPEELKDLEQEIRLS